MGKLTFTVNGVEMDEPTYKEYLRKVTSEGDRPVLPKISAAIEITSRNRGGVSSAKGIRKENNGANAETGRIVEIMDIPWIIC